MSSSVIESQPAQAATVEIHQDALLVVLTDGRSISVPVSWYPQLAHATPEERSNWRLIGRGSGIHWPLLDDDISDENVLAGKPSGESQKSLKRCLSERNLPQSKTESTA